MLLLGVRGYFHKPTIMVTLWMMPPWPPKIHLCLRCRHTYPLEWTGPFSGILQISKPPVFLQRSVAWPAYHGREYQPVDLFLAHLYAIVAGIGRIEHTKSLIHNGLLPPRLGLPNFPHRETLRTFLWRFDPKHLRSLQTAHD